jgi:ATP-dependent Clp protease adaptor protein ClpS
MATTTTIDPVTKSATSRKHYPNWRVIVLNDDHNSFQHVTATLVQIIPNMTPDAAWAMADRIHNDGAATVWSGPREQSELYYEQLKAKGLTMAPIESE